MNSFPLVDLTPYQTATTVFEAFISTLVEVQRKNAPSPIGEIYRRSRWHEWVNPHSSDDHASFERKQFLQCQWPQMWYYFQPICDRRVMVTDPDAYQAHCQAVESSLILLTTTLTGQHLVWPSLQQVTAWQKLYVEIYPISKATDQLVSADVVWFSAWPVLRQLIKQVLQQPDSPTTNDKRKVSPPSGSNQLTLFL